VLNREKKTQKILFKIVRSSTPIFMNVIVLSMILSPDEGLDDFHAWETFLLMDCTTETFLKEIQYTKM
jgi:hypothetical protein